MNAATVTCSECQRCDPSRVLMVTRDGHAWIRTFTGRSVACSSDGRRVLEAVTIRQHPIKAGAR